MAATWSPELGFSYGVDPPPEADSGEVPLYLGVSLQDMRPDDKFELLLPAVNLRMGVWGLLEQVFREERDGRCQIESSFDLKKNPDLPEIYAVLLDVFAQYRAGYCGLTVVVLDGAPVALGDPIAAHFLASEPGAGDRSAPASLEVLIQQKYQVLESVLVAEHWENKNQLLEWLQSLTLLYFLDKHEVEISENLSSWGNCALLAAVQALLQADIIESVAETGNYEITEAGRIFIGSLLSETEAHIDHFDIFKDVAFEDVIGRTEFGSGTGEDLRVQVLIAEGLDPIRVVFLLIMYDGSLDNYLADWADRLEMESFFNEILEPVANHFRVPDDAISKVIESGFAMLDEQAIFDRTERSRREILARLNVNRTDRANGNHF